MSHFCFNLWVLGLGLARPTGTLTSFWLTVTVWIFGSRSLGLQVVGEILKGDPLPTPDPTFLLLEERLWYGTRPAASCKGPCGRWVKGRASLRWLLLLVHLFGAGTLTTYTGSVWEGKCVLSLCPAKGASDHHWSMECWCSLPVEWAFSSWCEHCWHFHQQPRL